VSTLDSAPDDRVAWPRVAGSEGRHRILGRNRVGSREERAELGRDRPRSSGRAQQEKARHGDPTCLRSRVALRTGPSHPAARVAADPSALRTRRPAGPRCSRTRSMTRCNVSRSAPTIAAWTWSPIAGPVPAKSRTLGSMPSAAASRARHSVVVGSWVARSSANTVVWLNPAERDPTGSFGPASVGILDHAQGANALLGADAPGARGPHCTDPHHPGPSVPPGMGRWGALDRWTRHRVESRHVSAMEGAFSPDGTVGPEPPLLRHRDPR
jgi:hypothetical protein